MPVSEAAIGESMESLVIVDGGEAVLVTRDENTRRIPVRWLRGFCAEPGSDPFRNGQRARNSLELPSVVKIRTVAHDEEADCWRVRFEGETADVVVDIDQLLPLKAEEQLHGPDPSPFSSADPTVRGTDYEDLEAPTALRSFLETLYRRGYARIRNVPNRPAELSRVAGLLGAQGQLAASDLFEEVVTPASEHAREASRDDAPHTDQPYRDPIPGYLLQHCLESTGNGGETFVIDGMSAAATLVAEEPLAAVELTRWPALFRYRDGKVDQEKAVTILETGPDGSLQRISFNDRALVDFRCSSDRLEGCVNAYDSLARILQREGLQHRFRMQPGDVLIVNNRRVLHGRNPIGPNGSIRLACCYLESGDLSSTWRRVRSGAID